MKGISRAKAPNVIKQEKIGVLLLSHCGYSFIEALIQNVTEQGLESFVLSSRPLPADQHRIESLQASSHWFALSKNHELTWQDLKTTLDNLSEQGYHVACCLSVWEGYRTLMARANQALGVADMSPAKVERLLNKYHLRQQLRQAGLSQANAVLLTPQILTELQTKGKDVFVKPVTGIASYGTFRLTPENCWQDILQIQTEIAADPTYCSIFAGDRGFMAEDYIPGKEFSFEIIITAGTVSVIGIHEKLELDESGRTVLEREFVSPPIHLSDKQLHQARNWIAQLFQHLRLRWGCYHLEARFHQGHWEVIEINPRVGGALISDSVQRLTQGSCMTKLWLENLLHQSLEQQTQKIARLATFDVGSSNYQPPPVSTYFRLYFADPGQIRAIHQIACCLKPEIVKLFLKPGNKVANRAREVFLGQILWAVPRQQQEYLSKLMAESRQAIQVEYEQSPRLSQALCIKQAVA